MDEFEYIGIIRRGLSNLMSNSQSLSAGKHTKVLQPDQRNKRNISCLGYIWLSGVTFYIPLSRTVMLQLYTDLLHFWRPSSSYERITSSHLFALAILTFHWTYSTPTYFSLNINEALCRDPPGPPANLL
uniref:Uncharacterized protein n=1 Tax=Glossina austeni TaxID=7395 RepID=A0A1A9UUQ3_GLOAU